jgi:hypothetical protein
VRRYFHHLFDGSPAAESLISLLVPRAFNSVAVVSTAIKRQPSSTMSALFDSSNEMARAMSARKAFGFDRGTSRDRCPVFLSLPHILIASTVRSTAKVDDGYLIASGLKSGGEVAIVHGCQWLGSAVAIKVCEGVEGDRTWYSAGGTVKRGTVTGSPLSGPLRPVSSCPITTISKKSRPCAASTMSCSSPTKSRRCVSSSALRFLSTILIPPSL